MRRKTSGNTCARPISPTACSKTTPQSSTLVSSHGVAFSTSSVASSPSPAGIGLLPVNHSEVWYYRRGEMGRYGWCDGSDGRPRSWYIDVGEDWLGNEIAFLKTEIYLSEVEPRLDLDGTQPIFHQSVDRENSRSTSPLIAKRRL